MILVIFGAGASYDSIPSLPLTYSVNRKLPSRLPLANELFDDRVMFNEKLVLFPQCKALIPKLRSESNIESALQKYFNDSKDDLFRKQQLAAIRYYLQAMIWDCEESWYKSAYGITNHNTLIDHLRLVKDQGICIVTFNYDRLIEKALLSIDLKIEFLPDYISDEHFKLFKLHGSVNWVHPIKYPLSPAESSRPEFEIISEIIRNISNLPISEDIEIIRNIPTAIIEKKYTRIYEGSRSDQHIDRLGAFPAIAIPLEEKSKFECPAIHIETLASMIPKVDKILVIGWRATESLFLELLSKNLRGKKEGLRILVVNGSSDGAKIAASNLYTAGIQAGYIEYPLGFTSFITDSNIYSFLN